MKSILTKNGLGYILCIFSQAHPVTREANSFIFQCQNSKAILTKTTQHTIYATKIVSYNASIVKIYNATINLVRFEKKNIFFYIHTMKNALACYNDGVVVVNTKSRRTGFFKQENEQSQHYLF
jgi:hypothetical protein